MNFGRCVVLAPVCARKANIWLIPTALLRRLLLVLPRFLLCQHHHLVDEVGDPLLAETEFSVILTHPEHGLYHSRVFVVVLMKDIIDGLLSHTVNGALEKRRQSQLELHQVAREHHEVLRESLELY